MRPAPHAPLPQGAPFLRPASRAPWRPCQPCPSRPAACAPRRRSAEQLLRDSALAWPTFPDGCKAGSAESRRTQAALLWLLTREPSSVVPSSYSVAPPYDLQSPSVGSRQPAVPSRECNQSRICGITNDVVVVRSSPSSPGMSQTSQAHAQRRCMDLYHNTDEHPARQAMQGRRRRCSNCEKGKSRPVHTLA